jgi:hypothetical protein
MQNDVNPNHYTNAKPLNPKLPQSEGFQWLSFILQHHVPEAPIHCFDECQGRAP